MPHAEFRPNRWVDPLILVAALALRIAFLGLKPPHFDEGVNGWFVDQIQRNGFFLYDPSNYHGPLHFYLLFLFQALFGRSIWVLRMPTVLASLATIALVLRLDRHLPRTACRLAAAVLAISPAFVFLARYAIHETELVFFLVLLAYGLAELALDGSKRALWITVLAATGMILTKETYLVHFVAAAATLPCLLVLERIVPSTACPPAARRAWTGADLAGALAASLALIVFFYSGNFFQWRKLTGLYETFTHWVATGTAESGHEKPPWYWLQLLARYEWACLLGLLACARFVWPAPRQLRALAIYAAGTLLAYSLIPYKTPWLVISIAWPFPILLGHLIAECAKTRWLPAAAALTAIAMAHDLAASLRLNFRNFTDDSEPYVYVQTYPEVAYITGPLLELAANDPANCHLTGYILADSYYPLPWMLGDFTSIAYTKGTDLPETDPDTAFLLIELERAPDLEPSLNDAWFTDEFELRSGQPPLKLYLKASIFQHLFPGRTPELNPP